MAGTAGAANPAEQEDEGILWHPPRKQEQEPLQQPKQRRRWLRLPRPRLPRIPRIRCGKTRVRSPEDSRESRQPKSSQEVLQASRRQELDVPEDLPAAEPSRPPERKAELPRQDSQPETSVPEPEVFQNPLDFVDEVPPEFLIEEEEPPLPAPAEPFPMATTPSPAPSVTASSGRHQKPQRLLQHDPESESEREPMGDEALTDDISLNMIKLESWKVKPSELSLGDVLPAKTAAIAGIAEAIAQFDFEKAKDLKTMRDLLALEQASLWRRLFHCRHLHRQVVERVELAIKAEDFDTARCLHEVQRAAEVCIKGFMVRRDLPGSALMGSGYLDLGFASDLGLMRESFTVECWVYFDTLQGKAKVFHPKPSAVGGLPTLTMSAGHVELKRRNGQAHSALVKFSEKHWTHLAFTWSKTADGDFDVNVFQDGLQVAFGKEQRGVTTDSEVRLGSFSGKMTEFRIWNHARPKEQIEAWMCRRCKGDEEGLTCCLSLSAGQEFTDATLDPSSALEPGHPFAVCGSHRGEVSFDGDHPSQLKSWQEAESGILVSFDEDYLAKAWRWLDGQHVEEAKRRKEEAERRLAEEEVRKREEKLRHEEELRRQAEEKERRAKEDEMRRKEEAIQARREEAERRRERRMRPFKKMMNCGACTGGF